MFFSSSNLKVYKLSITIKEAKNLLAGDINGLSDPYIILTTPTIDPLFSCRTPKKKNTLNPKWKDQSFEFIMTGLDHLIEFRVMDWDLIGRDDYLGMKVINVAEFFTRNVNLQVDQWFRLEDVKRGAIRIQMSVTVEEEVQVSSESESGDEQRRASDLGTINVKGQVRKKKRRKL